MVSNMIPLVIHGFCWRRFVVVTLKLLSHPKANSSSVAVPCHRLAVGHRNVEKFYTLKNSWL